MSPTKPLSVDEFTLLEFFGEYPTQLDSQVCWAYNDSAYEAVQGLAKVSFAIAPAVKHVRILLTIGEMLIYEFNACGVEDVRYHKIKGRESLEVVITPWNSIWLCLKAQISMRQIVESA